MKKLIKKSNINTTTTFIPKCLCMCRILPEGDDFYDNSVIIGL